MSPKIMDFYAWTLLVEFVYIYFFFLALALNQRGNTWQKIVSNVVT